MTQEEEYFVHPTAEVDTPVTIGAGSKVWHFCHIMAHAVIGKGCSFGQNVFVASGVRLGNNVKVQNNVSIYEGVVCDDNVFLGPSMVFTNVINPRSGVVRKSEYAQTHLAEGVTVGANATIVCGVKLGKFAFVGAGTVVTKDVPPYALVVGNPGKQIGWMSEWGGRLEFGSSDTAICPGSKVQYQLINDQVIKIE